MSGSTVLIVDDERTLARAIKTFMTEAGYDATVAGDAENAMQLVESLRPDVVFADVRLPGMSGIELLRRIREFDPAIPVIIMTAHGTIEGAVEAVKLGAFDYMKKPVDLEELKLLADRARETALLKQELSYYRRRAASEAPFSAIVGNSPALRSVLDQVRQIAALNETPPVLITGETGTGKGLVARILHNSGPRADKPFIDVNCTALPANLMEAELFGYERGAFTDAKESKIGLFEAAEDGFLFLDEIGDLELSLQGKLLRAIEERTIRRVGGIRDRKVNVRILAATNRDLEQEVQQNRFRSDLYFRLAVILLHLPPLRERGNDTLLLAQHFLRRLSTKYGKDVRRIDDRARAALLSYPWPGNVRELSHVIERAVLWSRDDTLTVEHLSVAAPMKAVPEPAPASVSGQPQAAGEAAAGPAEQSADSTDLAQVERGLIERAMRDAGGNQTRAAQRLGISRDTLRYRLKKFGIQSG
ncbi:MAG: putative response regulator in two-component reguatory system, sigma54 dependent transcriptional [Geminicoccaceae bacterium]|nr:putative response regulator in two-component reguatory system, sigma54 dependent transcriptional [Geminicoccaceae bacterium]